jgi:hypothetical protein
MRLSGRDNMKESIQSFMVGLSIRKGSSSQCHYYRNHLTPDGISLTWAFLGLERGLGLHGNRLVAYYHVLYSYILSSLFNYVLRFGLAVP